MVYSLTYRRPTHVPRDDSARSSTVVDEKGSIDGSFRSGHSASIAGIPEALSFDRVITGGTCPVSL